MTFRQADRALRAMTAVLPSASAASVAGWPAVAAGQGMVTGRRGLIVAHEKLNEKDGKVMHPDLLNESMLKTQYAVRGELYLRASELQKEGRDIIFTNGNIACSWLRRWVAAGSFNGVRILCAWSKNAPCTWATCPRWQALSVSLKVGCPGVPWRGPQAQGRGTCGMGHKVACPRL